jgi:transposase
MSDLFWLSTPQLAKIEPYFPLAHGIPRVDDLRVVSGIIFVIRNGLPLSAALRLPAGQWMARCPVRLWAAQDALQSVHQVEPNGCF